MALVTWGRVWLATAVLVSSAAGCGTEDTETARWRLDYVTDSRDAYVRHVVAVSPNEGWAVATEKNGDGDSADVLLHRDGAEWRPAPTPPALNTYKGAELGTLAASGPDNVWQFGNLAPDGGVRDRQNGAVRWDGQRWSRTSVSFPVYDAVVLAPDNVWALDASSAGPAARHWDGTKWTEQRWSPAEYYLDSLAATGPDDVWASGFHGDQAAIMHYDGKRWEPVDIPSIRPAPAQKASIHDIFAVSRTNVWAFGQLTSAAGSPTTFAVNWNGSEWRKYADGCADPSARIRSQSGPRGTGDGAGGFVLSCAIGGVQHRSRDGNPTRIENPDPVAGRGSEATDQDRQQLFVLHDLTLVPGTRQVQAVGAVGIALAPGDTKFSRGVIASYTTGG
ncbi:hypothetical protein [Amycolatopsis minnesotensis]|uniref:Uncharacterized protein n=1 Tax=Amycolatopsis minnesotensis TaxID=337894 RepID=A0ABN2PZS1_9PSEU